METSAKRFRFVNSQTDNVIYYYSIDGDLSDAEIKEKLDAIKLQVATNNGVNMSTIYWEEAKGN